MIRRNLGILGLIGILATLAGCASRDPYQRDDVWYPTGSNAANLAAMVANPHDLVAGRGSSASNAATQVVAVRHIQTDTPKKLSLDSGGSGGGGSSSGSGPTAITPGGG